MNDDDTSDEMEPQEDLWRKASLSYFPILVMFTDTGEEMAFEAPSDIPSGRPFRVLGHQESYFTPQVEPHDSR